MKTLDVRPTVPSTRNAGSGRWNWTRNKRFLDDAIESGDRLLIVSPPKAPNRGGNAFQRELKYLSKRGYSFEKSGQNWVAVRR